MSDHVWNMMESECPKLARSRIARWGYMAGGVLCVALGMLGIFIPGLPTTIFLILAVGAFSKSCPPLEAWLLNHARFGPTLRDWQETRSIKRRTKVIALATIWVFIPASLFIIPLLWVKVVVVSLGLFGSWYLVTRKTKRESPLEAAFERGV